MKEYRKKLRKKKSKLIKSMEDVFFPNDKDYEYYLRKRKRKKLKRRKVNRKS